MLQLDEAKIPTSKIQVAKIGSFTSKRYGKFTITEQHVDEMMENLKSIVTEPPVDYHHLSMSASTPDQAIAAGWFKSLEKREDKSLWGTVEWTPKAAKHIEDKELRYVSPVIVFEGATDTKQDVGAVLLGAALTNYPFLKGMAPVSLDDLISQGILMKDMSLDEKRARVSQALNELWKNSPSWVWLRDLFDDYLVYEKDGKMFRQDYSIGDNWNIRFTGDPEEVVQQYVTLSSLEGKKPMAEDKKIETQNADIVKLQSDFTELSGKFTSLSTDLTAEKEENKKLRLQIARNEATAEVQALMRAGKVVPASKDKLVELCMKDPVFFKEYAGTLPVIVKLNAEHGTGEDDVDANAEINGKDPIKLFDDKVAAFAKENPKMSHSEVMSTVAVANPGLYAKRRAEFSRTTAVTSGSVQ
jgi:phage I-like protein